MLFICLEYHRYIYQSYLSFCMYYCCICQEVRLEGIGM